VDSARSSPPEPLLHTNAFADEYYPIFLRHVTNLEFVKA
jgi:hypothetical protein